MVSKKTSGRYRDNASAVHTALPKAWPSIVNAGYRSGRVRWRVANRTTAIGRGRTTPKRSAARRASSTPLRSSPVYTTVSTAPSAL